MRQLHGRTVPCIELTPHSFVTAVCAEHRFSTYSVSKRRAPHTTPNAKWPATMRWVSRLPQPSVALAVLLPFDLNVPLESPAWVPMQRGERGGELGQDLLDLTFLASCSFSLRYVSYAPLDVDHALSCFCYCPTDGKGQSSCSRVYLP